MSRSRGATSAVVLLLALACIASSAGTAQAGRFSETLEGARTRGEWRKLHGGRMQCVRARVWRGERRAARSSVFAVPTHHTPARRPQPNPTTYTSKGRHLLQGWFGGPGTESIMSANDAVGAIESAVDNDNFASTYAATQEGYADANAAGARHA